MWRRLTSLGRETGSEGRETDRGAVVRILQSNFSFNQLRFKMFPALHGEASARTCMHITYYSNTLCTWLYCERPGAQVETI